MSTDLLRETFVEAAASVDDTGLAARAAASRRRASRIRRQRAAIVVGVVALVLPVAGAALLGVNPIDRAIDVVQPPDPTHNGDLLRGSFAGRTLIDSKAVTGESDLELTVDASRGTEWRPVCRNVGAAYILHMTLDGGGAQQLPCDVDLLSGYRAYYTLDTSYPVQGEHTLRLWLTKTGQAEHTAPPDAVLAVGVYRLPTPFATLAGHWVFELDEDEGVVWEVARTETSEPGQRSLTSTQSAADGRISVDWYTSGSADREVQVFIDGHYETSLRLNAGGPGIVLAEGGEHTVQLKVIGPVPADTELAFAWRSEVPQSVGE